MNDPKAIAPGHNTAQLDNEARLLAKGEPSPRYAAREAATRHALTQRSMMFEPSAFNACRSDFLAGYDSHAPQISALKEENAVLKSQIENADLYLEQAKMTAKSQWRSKVESAEVRISALESERDDLQKLVLATREKLDRIRIAMQQSGKDFFVDNGDRAFQLLCSMVEATPESVRDAWVSREEHAAAIWKASAQVVDRDAEVKRLTSEVAALTAKLATAEKERDAKESQLRFAGWYGIESAKDIVAELDATKAERDALRAQLETVRSELAAWQTGAEGVESMKAEVSMLRAKLETVTRERDEAREKCLAISQWAKATALTIRDRQHSKEGRGHFCDFRSICESAHHALLPLAESGDNEDWQNTFTRQKRALSREAFAAMKERDAAATDLAAAKSAQAQAERDFVQASSDAQANASLLTDCQQRLIAAEHAALESAALVERMREALASVTGKEAERLALDMDHRCRDHSAWWSNVEKARTLLASPACAALQKGGQS